MAQIGTLGLEVPGGTPPPDIVTKRGFADLLEVHPSRITQLVAQGLPVEPNGRISVSKASAWIDANLDPDRRKVLRPSDKQPLGAAKSARAEFDRIRTDRARLELEKARGALVDRKAVESAIFARARAERDAHLAWAARLAPIVATRFGIDHVAVLELLDAELRRHLQDLADRPLAELTRDA